MSTTAEPPKPILLPSHPHDPAMLGPLRLALCTPIREYPPLADRKAVSILTINGLMLTVTVFFTGAINDQVHVDALFVAVLTIATAIAFALSAFAACIYAFRALVYPMPPTPDGLTFYRHIAQRPREEYVAEALTIDDHALLRQMLDYNYTLAVLSQVKFQLIGQSIRCSRLAFILFGLVLVSFVFF